MSHLLLNTYGDKNTFRQKNTKAPKMAPQMAPKIFARSILVSVA